jgi:glutamate--cysteine ligase
MISTPAGVGDLPISELEAESLIGTICFKTGPPGIVGAELEWLVADASNPALPVPFEKVREVLAGLSDPGTMPGSGALTVEPGGQVELSTAPARNLAECVNATTDDMFVLRQAFESAGLTLTGRGLDLQRSLTRVLELPRYAAMEEFFDRRGPWGRLMMSSTASVQVCLDAGFDDDSTAGYEFRWRLVHALGPILVAAFANSPFRCGKPTGWKCTRQLIWARLDSYRNRAPVGAEPCESHPDPRLAMVDYALDADVLCVRRPPGEPWTVPAGLTFRDWLRGRAAMPAPTADDLRYHLSTLFPPVRPQGHLELRMIDAQPGDGWIVPVALVTALVDDPVAAEAAMAAAEPVWHQFGAAGVPAPRLPASGGPAGAERIGPWLHAARVGLLDPVLARAAGECFGAADAALGRTKTPDAIRAAVADYADRYTRRCRCPADDLLDSIGKGLP